MIEVEHEPSEWDSWPAEHCYFCRVPTRYWYTPKNEPCCPHCADQRNVADFGKKLINRDEWR